MDEDLHARMKEMLFGDDHGTFSLSDMRTRQPLETAAGIENVRQSYNSRMIPDRKFYPSPKPKTLRQLQTTFDDLYGRNGEELYKYFDPATMIAPQRMPRNINGEVAYNPKDRSAANTVGISTVHLWDDPLDHRVNTLLHEGAHVDDLRNHKNPGNLFGEVEPINLLQHTGALAKMPNRDKYFKSGNWASNPKEPRANLRASLGEQPRGTTSAAHFDDLLKILQEAGGVTYTPSSSTSSTNQVKLRDKEAILKGLEMDMFPRERWLEPREPTYKEKFSDKINQLLKSIW